MKKYVKDMTKEELKEIFKNVESIRTTMWDWKFEENMHWQEEYTDIFFGKEWHKYINYHDYYSSFFLRIKDATKFFENIKESNYQYLSIENAEEYKKLYKQARKYYNLMEKVCNFGSDKYYDNEEKLLETCEKILAILENELHLLENIEESELEDYFVMQVEENDCFSECYIEDNDYTKLYEHIEYIKTY